VPGSAVLVGGEPGIGKSTLMLQAAAGLARLGTRVLYVSSEESAPQVRSRAVRLGATNEANLFVLADTNLARIVEQARRVVPGVMVIDSIQMVYRADLPASPGSPAQLRRCCAELVYLAKASGIAVVMVGHVTKDGRLAGPRLIEHLVDAVLAFEGDRHHAHRIVRALKNRFGTTLEIGLFEMGERGLSEVGETAAGMFAAEGGVRGRTGSVVCPVMTGTRCVMVELQALTATGFLGAAKRKSSGLDANRLAMLIAVLEQHAELRLADRDVFASSVGGIRVAEPASDLALLLAIAGAHFRRAIEPRTCALGEVGLGGEVRGVAHLEARLREAARLGFTRAIVPKSQTAGKNAVRVPGLTLDGVSTINEAIERLA
jgi:DNA repair protein RadA/Sms